MKPETERRLYEMAEETQSKEVTPFLLTYYKLEALGAKEKGIVEMIGNYMEPYLS